MTIVRQEINSVCPPLLISIRVLQAMNNSLRHVVKCTKNDLVSCLTRKLYQLLISKNINCLIIICCVKKLYHPCQCATKERLEFLEIINKPHSEVINNNLKCRLYAKVFIFFFKYGRLTIQKYQCLLAAL